MQSTKIAKRATPRALTAKQQQVLEYLKTEADNLRFPSIRDLMRYLEIRSPNGVTCHIRALYKKGYLERTPMLSRSIRIVGQPTPAQLKKSFVLFLQSLTEKVDLSVCDEINAVIQTLSTSAEKPSNLTTSRKVQRVRTVRKKRSS